MAYIPTEKVLGLSKLSRLARLIARGPRLQEDLTHELADILHEDLAEPGLGGLHRGPAHVHGRARRRRARGAARHQRRARRVPRARDARGVHQARASRRRPPSCSRVRVGLLHGFLGIDPRGRPCGRRWWRAAPGSTATRSTCPATAAARSSRPGTPTSRRSPRGSAGATRSSATRSARASRSASSPPVASPRAVLISVNPGIDDAERPARRAHDAAWARLLRERGLDAFLDAWEAQPLFATQARVRADLRAARRARRLALRSRAARAQPRGDGPRRDAGLPRRDR